MLRSDLQQEGKAGIPVGDVNVALAHPLCLDKLHDHPA